MRTRHLWLAAIVLAVATTVASTTATQTPADDARVNTLAQEFQAQRAEFARRVNAATASDVLDYLVRQLVDEPDGVEVDAIDRRGGVQLEVRVAPGDMGRVIGKRGRTAQAIRAVTRAAAVKDGVEVNIEFME